MIDIETINKLCKKKTKNNDYIPDVMLDRLINEKLPVNDKCFYWKKYNKIFNIIRKNASQFKIGTCRYYKKGHVIKLLDSILGEVKRSKREKDESEVKASIAERNN